MHRLLHHKSVFNKNVSKMVSVYLAQRHQWSCHMSPLVGGRSTVSHKVTTICSYSSHCGHVNPRQCSLGL